LCCGKRNKIKEEVNALITAVFEIKIDYDLILWIPYLKQRALASLKILKNNSADEFDYQLMLRIAKQDRESFAQLYDRFSAGLYSVAVKILNDPEEAAEVVQDVFLVIWEKAQDFDINLSKPFSWAFTLTRNKAIDRLRALQRRFKMMDSAMHEMPQGSIWSNAIYDQDTAVWIRSKVKALPVEQQCAIEMAFFGGMTQEEISEQLCEPLGTIKARIRRGMLKLRETLGRQL